MSNMFIGTGNIGTAPELRNVMVNGEARKVLEMRVFFDTYQRDSNGDLKQNDSASFWKDVTLWGDRAERAAEHLVKGARVAVMGELRGERWTDKESGEERTKDAVRADDIYLSFARVESVRFKAKAERTEGENATV